MEVIQVPVLEERLAQITNQLNALTNTVNNINATQANQTQQLNALTNTVNNMNAIQANHTQQLDHITATQANHTQQLDHITATQANHTHQINQLNNGMQGVNQRLAELAGQQAESTRRITSAVNTNAMTQRDGAFVAFPFANNVIHPGFPRTVRDLDNITGPQMTALLNANGINEIPNELEARRARVERLITTAL
jgi:septal ring factor EnvC (AmiA/AmiB activator)